MFSHVALGSNDLERSRRFYDALLGVLGAPPGFPDDKGRLVWNHGGGLLIVGPPIDGEEATVANGATIGFAAPNADAVRAWHDAGVGAGGTSVEEPPGPRQGRYGPLELAYLRDPDGNKLCAAYRHPPAG